MFDYEVLTESEAMQERFQLLPEGEYSAVIDDSIDKVSQNSGNPMMDMTLSVYDSHGRYHTVRDFLVFTKGMMWKVIHCAESAGLSDEYQEKKFCSNSVRGRNVKVRVSIEKGTEIPIDKLKGKAPGARYPDKNKIEDYISIDICQKTLQQKEEFDDDLDVPF